MGVWDVKLMDFVNIFFHSFYWHLNDRKKRKTCEYAQNVVIKVRYSGAITMSVSKCCF